MLTGAGWQWWSGLLLGGLVSALLVKRAACSAACPVFPVGELLWRTGERLFGRTFAAPFWFDLVLRSGKYLVLGWLVLAVTGGHLNDGLWGHFHGSVPLQGPQLMAGAQHTAPLLAATLVLSLFFQMPWCRYLCPYGALLGLISIGSLLKIHRSPSHCVRCHKCSNRCPASLPVMLRTTVRSPECFTCQRCVDGCPAPGALAFAPPGNRSVPSWLMGTVVSGMMILGLFIGMII